MGIEGVFQPFARDLARLPNLVETTETCPQCPQPPHQPNSRFVSVRSRAPHGPGPAGKPSAGSPDRKAASASSAAHRFLFSFVTAGHAIGIEPFLPRPGNPFGRIGARGRAALVAFPNRFITAGEQHLAAVGAGPFAVREVAAEIFFARHLPFSSTSSTYHFGLLVSVRSATNLTPAAI